MTNEQIERKVNDNRDMIQKLLSSDLPINIIHDTIKLLALRNERLLNQLNN